MSWIDNVSKKTEIFMGDGKLYRPSSVKTTETQEFNISTFDFKNVSGSLVKRQEPKGRVYKIEIIFQGENHLETVEEFKTSSRDKRHWHLRHNIYGDIRVQPSTLKYDNSIDSLTTITGTLIETINGAFPKGLPEPKDEIQALKDELDIQAVFAFTNQVVVSGNDIGVMNNTVDLMEANGEKGITDDADSILLLNAARKARASISKATSDVTTAMGDIKELINAPAVYNIGVLARQRMLLNQFNDLREGAVNDDASENNRKYYESTGSLIISTMLLSSSLPLSSDYKTRSEINDLILQLIAIYNQFLADLDALQLADFTKNIIYVPSYTNISALNLLLNVTVSNLFSLALNAKQEFTVTLKKDSNLIVLTHMFYGLDELDENMDFFISTNNIGINEHLNIKKGREINYYV
jgi:hypothetical protein